MAEALPMPSRTLLCGALFAAAAASGAEEAMLQEGGGVVAGA